MYNATKQQEVNDMRKKVVVKLSDTVFIEVEGELIYTDPEVGKSLPSHFST